MICTKCNEELQMMQASIDYLSFHLTEKVLCCPKCGQVFIPEELVDGKIAELETTLEEK